MMETKSVTFIFEGNDCEIMAEKFYYWFIDGGLSDQIVDTLSEMGPAPVSLKEWDNEKFESVLSC